MTTLTSSSKSDQGDMMTAFPFPTDQENDAIYALLSMGTEPLPSTTENGYAHIAENDDDETIDDETIVAERVADWCRFMPTFNVKSDKQVFGSTPK